MGCGLGMLLLDSRELRARIFVRAAGSPKRVFFNAPGAAQFEFQRLATGKREAGRERRNRKGAAKTRNFKLNPRNFTAAPPEVWVVASSSIAMTWGFSPIPPFRFAKLRDVGITVYLILVSIWSAPRRENSAGFRHALQ